VNQTRTPSAGERGFTLAETLVSLAVTGFAAVLVLLAVRHMGLALHVAERADTRLDPVQSAQFLLRERIERIEPAIDQQSAATVDLAGGAGSIDFVGAAAAGTGPAPLQRYRIALDRSANLVLYRLSTLDVRTDPRTTDTKGWTSTVLMRGVSGLSLHYFGAAAGQPGPVWQDAWSHRPVLPRLIRIAVTFPEGDARVWPDLYVRPRAATTDTCLRSAKSGECAT
jgi:general secretion pathway protein J